MPHGDNHAKQIVINQAKRLTMDLQNGCSGDVKKHGQALGLIVEMIIPLYEAEFVTVQECERQHIEIKKTKKITRIKLGPVEIEGAFTSALLIHSIPLACVAGVVFMAGKMQNWW